MSTIAAGTTSGTALVNTGDTTGALVLQTNGTTTAVTIGTNQVVTLAQPLPVASGGTGGSATPTAGGIVYGTGTVQAVSAAGTSGQVLQSNGASAPTWIAAPSSGALVFISSQTVSTAVASVDFTSGIDSTYDDYQILFENVTQSSAGEFIQFFLYQSGAFSTGYSVIASAVITGNIHTSNNGVSETNIRIGVPASATTSTRWRGNLLLQAVNSATNRVPSLMGTVGSIGNSTDQLSLQQILGVSNTSAVVTGFRVSFSAGNVSSGTFRLYGIKKS